mmetsp:Transcript_8227/g.15496  ORF Transcript_8227/g.15496 Transcript_8227/m.15496 type:complete len:310 (-) Transcript_8227:58-987(-)
MLNSVFGQTTRKIGGPLGAVALSSATTSMLMFGGQSSQRSTTLKATQNASRYLMTYSQPRSLIDRAVINHGIYPQSFILKSKRTFSTNSSASSNTSNSVPKGKGGLMEWYENHLENRPVTTKAVTGSILWGLGDVVAQVVPTMMQDTQQQQQQKDQEQVEKKEFQYDYPRTARAMFFGFGIHAPLSHLHYNFLEWMTVRGGFTGLGIPVFKTVMEQFVYWSWFSNSLYHGAMGAMQGKTFQQIYDRIADVLWDTQKAQWVFWIPVQLLNFNFVPVRHQLNVVLLTSVVWTALLSAWYPPEDDKDEKKND